MIMVHCSDTGWIYIYTSLGTLPMLNWRTVMPVTYSSFCHDRSWFILKLGNTPAPRSSPPGTRLLYLYSKKSMPYRHRVTTLRSIDVPQCCALDTMLVTLPGSLPHVLDPSRCLASIVHLDHESIPSSVTPPSSATPSNTCNTEHVMSLQRQE